MAIHVPVSVAEGLEEERREHHAALFRHLEVKGKIDHWNRLLREIDPRLQLVKAMESTTFPGLKPGYWCVIRDQGGAPPSIFVHQDPETGAFQEPDSSLLDRLRKGDMWDDRVQSDSRKRDRALARAAERQREHEREERIDETLDRYKAKYEPGMLVKGLPWKDGPKST